MNRRSNLDDIQLFMAVVDGGSFVAGGRALGLTGSAASKAVLRLEARLGVRLLHRTTRTVSLTDEGARLYDGGLHVREAIDAAEASVRGPSGEPHGTLRMTVPEAFGRHVVLPVVQRFLETWPEVRVDIDVTDRAANLVEEGFDLAFRLGDRVRADPGLISRIIARYPVGLVAAPDYLRVRNKPQTPEDLLHHETLLFRGRGGVQPWRYRDGGTRWVRLPVRGRLQMSSGTALRDAAVAGLGVAFLPSFVVKDDVAAGRLARVLPDLDLGEAVIAALYPSRRLLPPRVRRFIDLVFETTSDAPTNPRSS